MYRSSWHNVEYDEDRDRFESRLFLYDSEKERLPPNLSSRSFLSGGYYKREIDAAKASDMLSTKIVRSMDNRQLTMREYGRVNKMSWDELMAKLKKRAARKEREVVSEEEEEGGEEEEGEEASPWPQSQQAMATGLMSRADHAERGKDSAAKHEADEGEEGEEEEEEEEDNVKRFKGVSKGGRVILFLYKNKRRGSWKSVEIRLRTFPDPEEAARHYDRASYYAFGDKAKLNFPDEDPGRLDRGIAERIDEKLKQGGRKAAGLSKENIETAGPSTKKRMAAVSSYPSHPALLERGEKEADDVEGEEEGEGRDQIFRRGGEVKYNGVEYANVRSHWQCRIKIGNVRIYLKGGFRTREEAARLHDRAMVHLHGLGYAALNFPDQVPGKLEPEMAAKIEAKIGSEEGPIARAPPRGGKGNMCNKSGAIELDKSEDKIQLSDFEDEDEIAEFKPSKSLETSQDPEARTSCRGKPEAPRSDPEEDPQDPMASTRDKPPKHGYWDVYPGKEGSEKWRCQMRVPSGDEGKVPVHLRATETKEEAARVADRAYVYIYGFNKAKLNFPDEQPGKLEPDLAGKIDAKLNGGGRVESVKRNSRDQEEGGEEEGRNGRPSYQPNKKSRRGEGGGRRGFTRSDDEEEGGGEEGKAIRRERGLVPTRDLDRQWMPPSEMRELGPTSGPTFSPGTGEMIQLLLLPCLPSSPGGTRRRRREGPMLSLTRGLGLRFFPQSFLLLSLLWNPGEGLWSMSLSAPPPYARQPTC